MKRKIPPDIRIKALADYLDGVPPPEIRKRYGLKKWDVNNLFRQRGYLSQKAMRETRLWDRARRAA